MDDEKADAARRIFWPRVTGFGCLFAFLGMILIAVAKDKGWIPFHDTVSGSMAVYVGILGGVLIGASAVNRAGLSQRRKDICRLSSPRPMVDLPASEIRSDHNIWGIVALYFGFSSLFIFSLCLVHSLGWIHIPGPSKYGYGMGFVLMLPSLFFGWLWKKNGYLVCRIDEQGITSRQFKMNRLIRWEDIAYCEVITTYNLFGQQVGDEYRFLDKDLRTLASVGLGDCNVRQRPLFLERLRCWFAEQSNGITQEKETAKDQTPTLPCMVEPESEKINQLTGGR